ncbi:hypothetical protein BJY04DRAFT_54986 [Aspergillus karnatakaensis]|uniref:uncharacterized protein n=1 Tax=Aspergillus karnatakaensis TaxID=1810916 RepID=UPI003CCCFA0C
MTKAVVQALPDRRSWSRIRRICGLASCRQKSPKETINILVLFFAIATLLILRKAKLARIRF